MFGLMRMTTHIRLMREADRRLINLLESQETRYSELAGHHGEIITKLEILTRMQDPALRELLREKLTDG